MLKLPGILRILRETLLVLATLWFFIAGIEVPYEPNPVFRFRDQLSWLSLSLALIVAILSTWQFARRKLR